MAYSITVGGVSLNLVSFQEGEEVFRGEIVEAFNNTLLDGRDAGRRQWEGETDWTTRTTEASLRSATSAGPVSCSGLVLNETVTCIVLVRSVARGPDVQSGKTNWAAINVKLSLTFRETAP